MSSRPIKIQKSVNQTFQICTKSSTHQIFHPSSPLVWSCICSTTGQGYLEVDQGCLANIPFWAGNLCPQYQAVGYGLEPAPLTSETIVAQYLHGSKRIIMQTVHILQLERQDTDSLSQEGFLQDNLLPNNLARQQYRYTSVPMEAAPCQFFYWLSKQNHIIQIFTISFPQKSQYRCTLMYNVEHNRIFAQILQSAYWTIVIVKYIR